MKLIDNAINYLKNDSNIQNIIEIGNIDKNIYYIKDNGVGINNDYFDKLFKPIRKDNIARCGTIYGIGLAVAKAIIDKYSCSIWVESEGVNKGSCFYFTLPIVMK